MNNKFQVNYEVIDNAVVELRSLLQQCEKAYNKKIPSMGSGQGSTHTELNNLCNNIKINCQYLGELINSTILFLGETSTMFKTADNNSSSSITK